MYTLGPLNPSTLSFFPLRKKLCLVNLFLLWDESRSFFLPLSHIALQQLSNLEAVISSSLQPSNGHDEWTFIWESDQFSCSKVYSFLQGSHPVSLLFKWMWKCRVLNKHRFFFWLFLWDRINTQNLLQRKKYVPTFLHLCYVRGKCGGRHPTPLLWLPFE
jgi:hypothetical protein